MSCANAQKSAEEIESKGFKLRRTGEWRVACGEWLARENPEIGQFWGIPPVCFCDVIENTRLPSKRVRMSMKIQGLKSACFQ